MYKSMFLLLGLAAASCGSINSNPAARQMTLAPQTMMDIDLSQRSEVVNHHALETAIGVEVNQARTRAGLKPLEFSPELAAAARGHTKQMALKDFFEHRGEGEAALPQRIELAGLKTDDVGENIYATDEDQQNQIADECVTAWILSPGHRANMLSTEFGKTGVSVVEGANGENYVTEDFAR